MANRSWKASIDALDDLKQIAIYTREKWGVSQKNAYLSAIKIVFERLTENPDIGRHRNELAKDLMTIPVREHIVYYTCDDNHVYIVRILHQRRDPKRFI